MSKNLTSRQASVLSFIKEFAIEHGYPPTIPEIQEKFDIKSPNGVNNHIKALIRKGYLKRDSSRARALDIIGKRDGIPIIGRVAAGAPLLAQENLEGYFNMHDIYGSSDEVFMLRVTGESMIKAGIFDGDYVIVRMQQTVEAGEIGVAFIEDEATIKRIYRDGNIIRLIPENDSMDPITVMSTNPSFRIGGKVVGVVRRM
ncbi:MAG: repressor LexA [Candidatus Latescibacteria bacterium]|nr:repressor LexA [Candidatus Latescibacterota bacterium]